MAYYLHMKHVLIWQVYAWHMPVLWFFYENVICLAYTLHMLSWFFISIGRHMSIICRTYAKPPAAESWIIAIASGMYQHTERVTNDQHVAASLGTRQTGSCLVADLQRGNRLAQSLSYFRGAPFLFAWWWSPWQWCQISLTYSWDARQCGNKLGEWDKGYGEVLNLNDLFDCVLQDQCR